MPNGGMGKRGGFLVLGSDFGSPMTSSYPSPFDLVKEVVEGNLYGRIDRNVELVGHVRQVGSTSLVVFG